MPARTDADGSGTAKRPRSLIWIMLLQMVAGEATFSLLYARFPALPAFAAIMAVYFVVKMLGDALCRLTRRSVHEWGYLDDYIINELLFGYVFYVIPLSFAQAIAVIYFPTGSLPWRLSATALIAVGLWGILRRKKEMELAQAHKLGRRVRIKFGRMGEGNP